MKRIVYLLLLLFLFLGLSACAGSAGQAPEITSANLSDYHIGLAHDYQCDVDEPTVEGEAATYVIHASRSERFADMTGEYKLVLRWNKNAKEWEVDNDASNWAETNFSLNLEELYSPEYYWAAYPLTPAKSDPICFRVTDMTEDACTVTWWSEDYDDSMINGSYDGEISTSLEIQYLDGNLSNPCWTIQDLQLNSLKNSQNTISFTFRITPKDFEIVPSDESSIYVGSQSIPLNRIKNEAYYSDLILQAVKNNAHQYMIREGMDNLRSNPTLVWNTNDDSKETVWIDSMGYAGSFFLTGSGQNDNALYILYGMEIGIEHSECLGAKHGVMYYAVAFQDLSYNDDGTLSYGTMDTDAFNGSAGTVNLPHTEGGYITLYRFGSTSIEAAADYYDETFGKIYDITYIAPDNSAAEYLQYLEEVNAEGKIGASMNGEFVIVEVKSGSSAEEAGLMAGDVVIAVDGYFVSELEQEEVSGLIRGRVGTDVEITVLRDGTEYSFTVTRKAVN